MPSVVVFDCDGVLVDSEPLSAESLAEALRELGIDLEPAVVRQRYIGQLPHQVAIHVQENHGIVLNPHFWTSYYERRDHNFQARLQAMPGAEACVRELQADGLVLAVATQSSRLKAISNLVRTDLFDFFQNRIFSAYSVPRGKPHPDLFYLVAKSLNVAPHECVVIDDRAEGIAGAMSAGMSAMHFVPGDQPVPASVGVPLRGLAKLPSLLRDLKHHRDTISFEQTPVPGV